MAHQRATTQHQIGPNGPQTLVDEEILLLPTKVGNNPLHILVEVMTDLRSSIVDGRHGTQQRNLIIEGLTRIGDEDGRNTKRRIDDKRGRRGIPRRITARLERIANTAIGKRRGIGLLLHEQLTGKFLQYTLVAIGLSERIVFLSRTSRQRLKPVRIMVSTVFQRPLAHTGSHAISHFARQGRTFVHRLREDGIRPFVEILAHGGTVEYFVAEVIRRTSLGSDRLDCSVIDRRVDHLES